MKEKEALCVSLDHCWRHFELHAGQRLKTFNFFVVISTVVIASSARLMIDDKTIIYSRRLALLLPVISLIFFLLDNRNRELIRSSEEDIKRIEKSLVDCSDCYVGVFTNEARRKGERRLANLLSYTVAFRVAFAVSFFLGVAWFFWGRMN